MGDGASAAVDLRSDTAARPSERLLAAAAAAAARGGDAVRGEAGAVCELERRTAVLLGKPAALFLPSCTLANLLAVMVHCPERGAEVSCGDRSHLHQVERAGLEQLAGVAVRALPTLADGAPDLAAARAAAARLLCVETPTRRGAALGADWLAQARAAAGAGRLHVDGARLLRAAEALRVEAAELAAPADSVAVCFVKGLGAPLGAALVGAEDFIQRARAAQLVAGGAWRQAGGAAGAVLAALDDCLPALYCDQRRAAHIAAGVRSLGARGVRVASDTNMVVLEVEAGGGAGAARLVELLGAALAGPDGAPVLARAVDGAARLVLHRDVDDAGAALALAKLRRVLPLL